jgi:hypothetical protein
LSGDPPQASSASSGLDYPHCGFVIPAAQLHSIAMQAVPTGVWEQTGQGGEETRRERVRISLPSMVVENRLQYSLMTNNSDAERASTSPGAAAHKTRFVWWAGSVVVLIGLAVFGNLAGVPVEEFLCG